MNDDSHAAFDHAANCLTLCTILVHIVEILNIAYGRSWKSRRMSWIRNGAEIWPNISKTCVQIFMRSITDRKRWKVIGPCHSALRLHV